MWQVEREWGRSRNGVSLMLAGRSNGGSRAGKIPILGHGQSLTRE